ncbi:MAG TPA: hypothetical protein ENK17_03095 [Anaerolineae bacterium]|nr:hypothetical protein [Anaerolineae bacterium]
MTATRLRRWLRRSDALPLLLLVLLAFSLRVYRLAEPVLRWDEGWTIAHGHLPWPELFRVAMLEWHPPLFYALVKLWLPLAGQTNYAVRYLAVLAGTLTVPLAYAAAREWAHSRPVSLLSALYAAAAPLLVYYGQVNRMYAWTPVGVLLATWALLRATDRPRPTGRDALVAGLATAIPLYLLYYTVWPLAALYLFALLARRHRRVTLTAGLVALLLFLPWLAYATPTVQSRLHPAGPSAQLLARTWKFVPPTVYGFVFAFARGWVAVWLTAALLAVGGLLTPRRRLSTLLLPTLAVVITVGGVAYGAQAVHFFAVRHLTPAAPFLGFFLAWGLDRLRARWKPLLPIALAALLVTFWPTGSRFVYEKALEVVDPFDPTADWRYLAPRLLPGDLVFFNNLAKAGWYEQSRAGQGAPWDYALRWDPIIEPLSVIGPRVEEAMEHHTRLWFVLYKGGFGPNNDLRAWLDANESLYPLWEGWEGDTLFLGYVVPHVPLTESPARAEFASQPISLIGARLTPQAQADGSLAVELTWRLDGPVTGDEKVFLHVVAEDGHLVAQHDARPDPENRPTQVLAPSTVLTNRHGVTLPPAAQGTFYIRVGLYDFATGERLLLDDGADYVTIGSVTR